MSRKPESIFCDKVKRDLKKRFGTDTVIFNIQQVAVNGTPDLLVCIKGRFVALELKIEKGEASKIQLLKLTQIMKAEGLAFVVKPSQWEATLDYLEETLA